MMLDMTNMFTSPASEYNFFFFSSYLAEILTKYCFSKFEKPNWKDVE